MNRDTLKAISKYAIGFGLLGFVVYRNWSPTENPPSPGLSGLLKQQPNWLPLISIFFLGALTIGLQFYRWYVLVRAVDLPFTKHNALRLGLVGYFYNQFLPGAIAGDFVKAIFIAKEQPERKSAAVATVVIDRLFGLFGLLLLVAICGGTAWSLGDQRIVGNNYLQKIIVVAICVVATAVVIWIILGLLSENAKTKLGDTIARLPKVGKSLNEVWYAVMLYRKRANTIYFCVLISALSHTCMQLKFHMATRAFPALAGDAGTLVEHFVIGPIGFIAQVFFPAPGGVGGAEAIFGYLYTLIYKDGTQTGVVARLTIRLVAEYSLGMIGYITYLRMKKELPTEQDTKKLEE